MLSPMSKGSFQISNFKLQMLLLICVGLLLRLWGGLSTLLFTYDQSRDAFAALGITQGDFKLVGPASDITGLFHGPLYYYLIAPFYLLGGGDPRVVLIAMIISNLLATIPLFFLVEKLFRNRTITVVTILLFMVSFEAVSYARWLSNPALAVPTMALYYLGLWMVLQRERLGWVLLGLGVGLSIQSQIFLIYLGPITLFALALFRVRPFAYKYMAMGIGALSFCMVSFLLAELKFKGQGIKGLLSFFFGQEGGGETYAAHLHNYWFRFQQLWHLNIFPLSMTAAIMLGFAIIAIFLYNLRGNSNKRPLLFILFLLFSHSIIFVVSGVKATFINVGVGLAVIMLAAYVLWYLGQKSRAIMYALLALITAANGYVILRDNPKGSVLFEVQHNMRFGDELAIVERTYQVAQGQPFGIASVTNPLFVPTTWAYVYQWYAKDHGLAVPFYRGNAASDYAGNTVFPHSDALREIEFFIIEPQPSIPDEWINKTLAEEEKRGPFTDKTLAGTFTLYTRIASTPALTTQ